MKHTEILELISINLNKNTSILFLVLLAIILDIITGLIRSKIKHDINSLDANRGFWKKISLLAALFFGTFLDALQSYIFPFGLSDNNLELPFLDIISIYICINESISICENLHDSGIKLPKFILNALKLVKNKLDQ